MPTEEYKKYERKGKKGCTGLHLVDMINPR